MSGTNDNSTTNYMTVRDDRHGVRPTQLAYRHGVRPTRLAYPCADGRAQSVPLDTGQLRVLDVHTCNYPPTPAHTTLHAANDSWTTPHCVPRILMWGCGGMQQIFHHTTNATHATHFESPPTHSESPTQIRSIQNKHGPHGICFVIHVAWFVLFGTYTGRWTLDAGRDPCL